MSFIRFNNKFIRLGGKLGKLIEPPKCPDAPTEIGWRVDDGILYIRAHEADGYQQRTEFSYDDAGVNSSISNTITKAVYEEPIAPATASFGMYHLRNFEKIINPEYFYADYCTNMNYMFNGAGDNNTVTTFDIGDLSNWNVSNVTGMDSMFYSAGSWATTFDIGDLSGGDVSNVEGMGGMFNSAGGNASVGHIGDISGGNTSKVKDMSTMFAGAGENADYSLDLSGWNVTNVTSHNYFNYVSYGVVKVIPPVWVD